MPAVVGGWNKISKAHYVERDMSKGVGLAIGMYRGHNDCGACLDDGRLPAHS